MNSVDTVNIALPTEETLMENAKKFEMAWLRPKTIGDGKELTLRMRVNKKWTGWKLKDAVVESVGLEVGDTINTEVSILLGPDLIDDVGDTDLFASAESADWLLENEICKGSVIDGRVKLIYSQAPVGGVEGRLVWRISIVLLEGIQIINKRDKSANKTKPAKSADIKTLRELLGN
ncbi:MAG: hypothetical protein Q4B03_08410 [Lachnospiraceae bacterium]|nr:hypothetical protein [Lachnospiraceae bacterium]